MRRKSVLSGALLAAGAVVILLPMAVMAIWVFTERWAWPALWPQSFSLRAVREVLHRSGQLAGVLASSVGISLAVAVLSVIVGLMTARAVTAYDFPGKGLAVFFTSLPLMVPVTVFAMGVQVTFIRLGLNNTVHGVILAHLLYSLPYAVYLITDGMRALGVSLEEQARVLGATGPGAFRRVTLPLLAPVLLAAFSMAYIVSFSQYFLTLLLGGGQVKTFTMVMVPYLQGGERNIASVYSVLFLAVTFLLLTLFGRLARRWMRHGGGDFYG